MSNTELLGVVIGAVVLMWMWNNYEHTTPAPPWEAGLPFQKLVDIRRWRHNGDQPDSEKVGNRPTTVVWPEVGNLNFLMGK